MIKIALTCLVLAMCSINSNADEISLAWDVPTQRVDGGVLDTADIQGYKLKYKIDGVEQTLIDIPLDAVTHLIPASAGQYEFSIATLAEEVGPYSDVIYVTVGDITEAPASSPDLSIGIMCTGAGGCTMEIR